LIDSVVEAFASITANMQRPVLDEHMKVTHWEANPASVECKNRVIVDLPAYCSRVISIERAKGTAKVAKSKAKRDLKEAADVQMADAKTDDERLCVEDIVNCKVASAFKKLSLSKPNSAYAPSLPDSGSDSETLLLFRKRPCQAEEGSSEGECEDQGEGPSETCHGESRRKGKRATWLSRYLESEQGKAEQEVIRAAQYIKYDNPSTYPDSLFKVPAPIAISTLIMVAPPEVRRAARIHHEVHVGPGVSIDTLLNRTLGVGLQFLLFRKYDDRLLMNAYDDFCERLRWKVYFMKQLADKGLDEVPREYDPDYDLHLPRTKEAESLPAYVRNHIARCKPFSSDFRPNKSQFGDLVCLQAMLQACNYIVTMTDKNLGCAIVTRQWFIDGSQECLADRNSYVEVSPAERQVILEETVSNVRELADLAELAGLSEQLCKHLVSKCPKDETCEPEIPWFYGIPKIHKQPVKFRPIVPCHSCVQAPAAKYVSKCLKPILERCKHVLKGTKQLAIDLAKANISPYWKKFLVMGDVVAFYPSLLLEQTIDLVIEIYRLCNPNNTPRENEVFERAIRLANYNLLCEFNSVVYRQIQGLAMGVACSPDIANLWGAYFEDHHIINDAVWQQHVPFYRRFIDDMFMIVYANSAEEALCITQRLRLDDPDSDVIKLTWEVSEYNVPFLDMLVYVHPIHGTIEHKPYQKKLNHLECVPWTSHHPKDIKKGTFIGEMSRFATLNSTIHGYSESIHELHSLYISRGYPKNLLDHWIKDHFQKR